MQELINSVVEYFKANPVHFYVAAGLAAALVITIFVLIGTGIRNAKKKKALKKAAKAAAQAPALEEIKEEPAVTPSAAQEEEVLEPIVPATLEETPAQPAKAETAETVKEPIAEETVVEEPIAEEPVVETPVQEETAQAEVKETAPTEDKKAKAEKVPSVSKKKKETSKEKEMLIDELKDINTEIDFYEESETDQVARYSGKWVICRVVTEEKTNEEDEMYFFELHASNGEKLLSSEEYTTYAGALRGIQTHRTNILRDNFKITLSKKGDYIFKLLNGKGMLLCMGEHYTTKARCESAIASTKRFAKTAIIDEDNIIDHVIKVPVEDDSPIEPLAESHNGKWIIERRLAEDGESVFYFELYANNGEKLLSSEEYSTYIGAVNGIQTHKNNIEKGNFRITLTKRGDYIYKLLNGNAQLLCLGEHYKTKRRCLNAVESVKRFALNSPILTDPEHTK